MYPNAYPNSTHTPAPAHEQNQSSSDTSSGEVNAFNDSGVPPSRLESFESLEFQGGPYDFSQPGPVFSTQGLASHFSVFPLALGMPLLPRNPSQVYGAQPHENVSDSAMGTSIFGEAPPIPYEQPEQENYPNEKTAGTGVNFAINPPTATVMGVPPPPPGVRSTPDAQGIFDSAWQLSRVWIEHQGHDDLRLVIHLKKIRSA